MDEAEYLDRLLRRLRETNNGNIDRCDCPDCQVLTMWERSHPKFVERSAAELARRQEEERQRRERQVD